MAGICFVIVKYSKLFANKDGLIRNKRASIESLQKNLESNALQICESANFDAQQAMIFALNADTLYKKTERNRHIYRLDKANALVAAL